MEPWQSAHIKQNISKLVDYTYAFCDINFLLAFQEKELLTSEDVTSIKIIQNPYDKCWRFYELMQRKTNSYEPLKAVFKDKQLTGALEILQQANARTILYKNFGTISYDRNKLLGRGSYNTKVFQGRFESRDVAVKIISIEDVDYDIAVKEIEILTNLDWHINIIRYFKAEFTDDFILIAIELCKTNLDQFVSTSELLYEDAVDIIKQITEGLIFLHSKQIVHRDLKPGNILILCHEAGKFYVKVTDFGLSRKLQDGMSKITSSDAVGTPGWMSPEVIRQLDRKTNPEGKFYVRQSADIFSLGCIFYFVLTGGEHPFGNTLLRQANILFGKSELESEKIKTKNKFRAEAFIWLINQMIKDTEKERPPASYLFTHPAFWKSAKILAFFQDLYPHIEALSDEVFQNTLHSIAKLDNWNWLGTLDKHIKNYLESAGAVGGTKCSHLLKVIVELHEGYSILPKEVQQTLGRLPDEYLIYWGNQFPFLLPMTWTIYQYSGEQSASTLKGYYPTGQEGLKFDFVGTRPTQFTAQKFDKSLKGEVRPLLNIVGGLRVDSSLAENESIDAHCGSNINIPATDRKTETFSKDQVLANIGDETLSMPGSNKGNALALPTIHHQKEKKLVENLNQQFGSISLPASRLHHKLPDVPICYISIRLMGDGFDFTEEELFNDIATNVTSKTIVISGPLGMGKATLLAQLGRKILKTFPERNLIYLKLREVFEAIKMTNIKDTGDFGSILDALTEESEFGKFYLSLKRSSYSSSLITEFILDELHDVMEDELRLVCKVLNSILVSFPSTLTRIWITTIPKYIQVIENITSNVVTYSLEPIDETSQINLISHYFEIHASNDKRGLPELAKRCVTHLNISKAYDLGNPLQCLLVGAAALGSTNFKELKNGSILFPSNIADLNNVDVNVMFNTAKRGTFRALEVILNLNKFDINCADVNGNTPLFYSVFEFYNIDCLVKLKLLIERGANLNHLNKYNYNLLHYAARYGSVETLSYILNLNKFNVNCLDVVGNNPLFLSSHEDLNVACIPKMKLLTERGANLEHLNQNGSNLLHIAAGYGSVDVLEYAISLDRFDMSSVNKHGETAMDLVKNNFYANNNNFKRPNCWIQSKPID